MAATKLSTYQAALRHLADARLNVIADDVTSRYAMDDAWDATVAFVLRQAPWRFALKTVGPIQSGTPIYGYAYNYQLPSDWLRTHAIFISGTDGREFPLDVRHQGTFFSVNVSTPRLALRYVSADFADPALAGHPWPEHFAQVVAAYLAFSIAARVTGDRNAPGRMSELFSSLLPEAAAIDAVPENLWLPAQLDGTFLRVARTMIDQGFWRFALVAAEITASAGAGDGGLAERSGERRGGQ